jgi:hypothetical protein
MVRTNRFIVSLLGCCVLFSLPYFSALRSEEEESTQETDQQSNTATDTEITPAAEMKEVSSEEGVPQEVAAEQSEMVSVPPIDEQQPVVPQFAVEQMPISPTMPKTPLQEILGASQSQKVDTVESVPMQPQSMEGQEEQKTEETAQSQEVMEPSSPLSTVDTMSLEEAQGNWLSKRIWWERAEEMYEKIRTAIGDIMDKRMEIFSRRTTLDRDLFDPVFIEIGVGIAELETIIQELVTQLDRAEEEGPSDAQRAVLNELRDERASLDELKNNITSLRTLETAVETALSTLLETVNTVRRHERDAWNSFKEIGRVLSEKRARELYYKIDVAWQNIKQLAQYIEKTFSQYFSTLEERAKSAITALRTQFFALKDKGIDLKERMLILTKQESEEEKELEERESEQEKVQKSSWWSAIVRNIRLLWPF